MRLFEFLNQSSLVFANILIISSGLAVYLQMRSYAIFTTKLQNQAVESASTWSMCSILDEFTSIFPQSGNGGLELPIVKSLVGFNKHTFKFTKGRFATEIVSRTALSVSSRNRKAIPIDHLLKLLYVGFQSRRTVETSSISARQISVVYSQYGIPTFLQNFITLFPLGGVLNLKQFGIVSFEPTSEHEEWLNGINIDSVFTSLTIVNDWCESAKISLVKADILNEPHGFQITTFANSDDLNVTVSMDGSIEQNFSIAHLFFFLTDLSVCTNVTNFMIYSGIKYTVTWNADYVSFWIFENVSKISSAKLPPKPRVVTSANPDKREKSSGVSKKPSPSNNPHYTKFGKEERDKLSKLETQCESFEAKNGPGTFFTSAFNHAAAMKLKALRAARKKYSSKKPESMDG